MKHLNEGNIYKNFILYAIPLVLSGILTQAYHIVDTMIAGRYLGETGLAAIGSTSGLISLLSSLFWGWTMGFGVFVGKRFGACEYDRIKKSFYSFVLIFSVIVIAICGMIIALYRPIFSLLNVSDVAYHGARNYFLIYISGLFLIIVQHACSATMCAMGESKVPLLFSIVSMVINIGGNLLTVIVFGWGTAGLAVSSLFSCAVVLAGYFIKFRSVFRKLGVTERIRVSTKNLKGITGYGLPVMLQQSSMYLAGAVVSPFVNALGSSATAGYSIANQLSTITATFYWNTNATISHYTSQCMGAKDYHKIHRGIKVGLLQTMLFVLPILLITIICPQLICNLFFQDPDATGLTYAVHFGRYFMPFALLAMIDNMFHGLFRAVKSMDKLITATLINTAARIISSIILVKFYGIYGIFAGFVVGWFIEAVYTLSVFFAGKWIPKKLRQEYKEACENAKNNVAPQQGAQ